VTLGLLSILHVNALLNTGRFGTDYSGTLWIPARAVLDGTNPYALAGSDYPPSAYLPLLPLGALPLDVAEIIWSGVLAILAVATLWILGVRDRRCYAVWLLTPLIFPTVLVGNATIVVVFLCAALWRFRDHAVRAGLALGAAVAVKLFAAPLVVWLIWTRRYRAAAIACTSALAVIVSAWALIDFQGLGQYPRQLSYVSKLLGQDGEFLQALLRQAGLAQHAAFAIGVAVGVALLLLAGALARMRSDDAGSFAVSWLSILALSPIGWPGYAAGIVIGLAAAHPSFSRRWLVLLGFWTGWWYGPLAYKTIGLSIASCLVAVALASVAVTWQRVRRPEPAIDEPAGILIAT
jgi:alpha-1,2-mannosyltransferase